MKSVLERNLEFIGYPNYSVDTEGNVWSLNYHRTFEMKKIKTCFNRYGYLLVTLFKDGIPKRYLIHQLVAKAFLPNPNHYPQVNHKDEFKKYDNSVKNLEWCDTKYNSNYGTRNKRIADKLSKKVLQIDKNTNEVIKVWKSSTEVEREKGYNKGNISACCLGRRKSAYGYIWRYI